MACGPDQHVRGPNGRHAVFRNGVDLQLRISGVADERRHVVGVREREGLPLQKVMLQRWQLAGERLEQVKRRSFARDWASALALHHQRRVGNHRR